MLDKIIIICIIMCMKAKEIIKILKKDGWYEVAQKGSHKQFKHRNKKGRVTVPYHNDIDLGIYIIKSIEKQANIKIKK